MELRLYLSILRRRWPIVLAVPLLVAAISAGVALAQPARYATGARLLVTRGAAPGSSAGLTDLNEDKTALDTPAILSGQPFRRDLAAELARSGRLVDEAALAGAINAGNQDHVVSFTATAATPEDAVAIGQAAVALLERNGLRYWGDPNATPEQPGLNVAVLDAPGQANRVNGLRTVGLDVALRTLLALFVVTAVAFALHYFEPKTARLPTDEQPARIRI